MTYLSASQTPAGAADRSPLRAALAWAAEMFSIFGAAGRVAQAVEIGREASAADLRVLGIRGPLPKIR